MRIARAMLFFLGSFICCLYAQQDSLSVRFPGEHNFGKSQIYLNNSANTFIKASSVTIINDSLVIYEKIPYDDGGGTKTRRHRLDDIYIIKASRGSYAAEYCLAGLLVGGVSALLGVNDNGSNSQYGELDPDLKKSMVLGFTLAGAVIGGIWGAATPKWEIVYRMGDVSQHTLHMEWRFTSLQQNSAPGITLCLKYL